MRLYADTSALIKLVVIERGSSEAEALWAAAESVACCLLGRVEGRVALAAAHRRRRLDATAHLEARERFEEIWRSLDIVILDDRLVEDAVRLVERYPLRGYDAVHLAAAQKLRPAGATLVAWDAVLREAAEAEGLPIAPATV